MSLTVQCMPESDGTLKYLVADHDVIVRVLAQRRNGTKKCPVELFHQAGLVLVTDCDLRQLRDVETLYKHANTLRTGPPWHEILTTVAAALPDHVPPPWTAMDQSLDAYTVTPTHYLWYPVLPIGEPVSLEGDPGTGKSATLVKILCHLTSGTPFPTLFLDHPAPPSTPRTVLLFTHEDKPASTIHPRVLINGGNPALIRIIEGKRHPETGAAVPMTLQDLDLLDALLTKHAPALVAFDPVQSFFGPEVDMNRASDTRPILDAVAGLCERHHCTPLYVRHYGKSDRSKVIHSGLGSIDITAHMRRTLALYQDPADPQRRILADGKTNGRPAPSMALRLVGVDLDVETDAGTITVETVRVDWDGMSELTAADLNAHELRHGGDSDEANSALDAAREFLREVLTDGPQLADEIATQAKKAGVSLATLRRAKDKEQVKARRRPQDGVGGHKWPWEWYDPARHSGTT